MSIKTISGKELFKLFEHESEIKDIKNDRNFTLIMLDNDDSKFNKERVFIVKDKINISKEYIFLVEKNMDFTEGAGPMRVIKAFTFIHDAFDFILSQKGIYGSDQYSSYMLGVNIYGEPYAHNRFNGYNIRVMELN
jgi:hypothetical protein